MAKRVKYHPHGSVLFCTFSLEEGLLSPVPGVQGKQMGHAVPGIQGKNRPENSSASREVKKSPKACTLTGCPKRYPEIPRG